MIFLIAHLIIEYALALPFLLFILALGVFFWVSPALRTAVHSVLLLVFSTVVATWVIFFRVWKNKPIWIKTCGQITMWTGWSSLFLAGAGRFRTDLLRNGCRSPLCRPRRSPLVSPSRCLPCLRSSRSHYQRSVEVSLEEDTILISAVICLHINTSWH